MTSADINSGIRWAWTKSSKTLLSSQASVKSSGQGGSSDTSHHCSWLCRQVSRWGASVVSEVESAASVEHMQMCKLAMGCCCRVQSLFLPWWDIAFGIEYNYKVYHCSNGNILELSCCKKSCLLWVYSIHVHIEEMSLPHQVAPLLVCRIRYSYCLNGMNAPNQCTFTIKKKCYHSFSTLYVQFFLKHPLKLIAFN